MNLTLGHWPSECVQVAIFDTVVVNVRFLVLVVTGSTMELFARKVIQLRRGSTTPTKNASKTNPMKASVNYMVTFKKILNFSGEILYQVMSLKLRKKR